LLDDLPRDLAGISRVAQGLVYHYFADEAKYGYAPPKERREEVDLRYLEAMLARLQELNDCSLGEPRAYANRLVGCCRDFSLIACAILRHQGVPARLRYGFAGYFAPGWWIDHVIVETWDDGRWRRFDPEIAGSEAFDFDTLDLPDGAFSTGGRAWQMVRQEGADPARFGLGPEVPDVSGAWVIWGRLQLDCASLNRQELLCWDEWPFEPNQEKTLRPEVEALLDRAAELSLQADSSDLLDLVAREPRLQVPPNITCWSPAVGPHPLAVR
jgi:hypothetical protein